MIYERKKGIQGELQATDKYGMFIRIPTAQNSSCVLRQNPRPPVTSQTLLVLKEVVLIWVDLYLSSENSRTNFWMAESGAGEALRVSVTGGGFSINITTDDVQVARDVCTTLGEVARDVCKTVTTLGALYLGYKLLRPLIESAVKKCLGDERDDTEVRRIRPGSLHVLLGCLTDKRFLEVLKDYESGKMKERLQEEFSQIGIKVEGLKVEIENMAEVNETKEAINKRGLKIVIDEMESHTAKNVQ
ncbi:Hypothetical predicted protein, partial [Paramuricea clavata]